MQCHNFYGNKFWELLTENGGDVSTVNTDTFAIRQTQLGTAMGAADLGGGHRKLEAR